MTIKLRLVKLTDSQIQKKVDKYNAYEVATHGETNAIVNTLEDYTCNACIDKYKCDCSFDPYNVSGDCLYDK